MYKSACKLFLVCLNSVFQYFIFVLLIMQLDIQISSHIKLVLNFSRPVAKMIKELQHTVNTYPLNNWEVLHGGSLCNANTNHHIFGSN
jgi:hypothetical protein